MKEHFLLLRNKIAKEYEVGKGYRKISMQICVPVNSVKSIIIVKKWKEQGAVSKKPRMGDPRKITARAAKLLLKL